MSLFIRGKEVPNPCTAIRMFALCDAMKWSHLPEPGGLYAQDPALLDAFRYIFAERGKEQEKERKRNEKDAAAKSGRGRPLGRAR